MSDSKKPNDGPAARELEDAHKHADPNRGDKESKDGDRVSTNDEEPAANPGN